MKTLAIVSTDKITGQKKVEHLVPGGMPLQSARNYAERTYANLHRGKTVSLVYGSYDEKTDTMLSPCDVMMVIH